MPPKTIDEINAFNWGALSEAEYRKILNGLLPDTAERKLAIQLYGAATKGRAKVPLLDTADSERAGAAVLQNLMLIDRGLFTRAKDGYQLPFWVEYFWKEANSVSGSRAREVMARFVVKTGNDPDVMKRTYAYTEAARLTDTLEPVDPALWRGILVDLLKIGFRAVDPKATQASQGPTPLPDGGDAIVNCKLDDQFIRYVTEADVSKLTLFLRGESRPWAAIAKQGTKRMSAVDDLRRVMKIDQAWHPFKLDEINRYLWYRQGQNDNDYYTVVSIAMEVEDAACYPKIDEERIYKFPRKPLSDWSAAERLAHRENLALVQMRDGKKRCLLASRITVYMFVVNNTVVLDTKKAGGGYPEQGVEEILIDNIFGYFEILRLHHGPQPEDGFTAFVTGSGFNRRDQYDVRKHFGVKGYEHCLKLYKEIRDGKHRFKSAWKSSGHGLPRISMDIVGALQAPLDPLALRKLDAAAW